MRTIRFGDGTEINGDVGLAEGLLWLWFYGSTIQETAAIALDTEKTSSITFVYGDNETTVYDGYTDCILIAIDKDDGRSNICLRRHA